MTTSHSERALGHSLKSASRVANGRACAICNALLSKTAAVHLSEGSIYTCPTCGSGILIPRPSASDLAGMHSGDDYFDHPYFQVRRELSSRLAASYERRLLDIERWSGPLAGKRLLDVGCDMGLFVQFAQERRGVLATGVDVSERAVGAGQKAGLDLRHGTLEQIRFDAESFDILSGYDLIEHVSDPRAFVREVGRVLKPGGVAVFETPNYGGLVYLLGRTLAKLRALDRPLRPYQARLWPAFHVQYFTEGALDSLLRAAELIPIEIRGRELSASELAISSRLLCSSVLALFAIAGALGSHTLLTAAAMKKAAVVQ
jgi:2-polyprenyl-3-methyl-5-hydroxy-6-metoxy-1,4-benzoquinol methylase